MFNTSYLNFVGVTIFGVLGTGHWGYDYRMDAEVDIPIAPKE